MLRHKICFLLNKKITRHDFSVHDETIIMPFLALSASVVWDVRWVAACVPDPRDSRSSYLVCNHPNSTATISKLVKGRKVEEPITTFTHPVQGRGNCCTVSSVAACNSLRLGVSQVQIPTSNQILRLYKVSVSYFRFFYVFIIRQAH